MQVKAIAAVMAILSLTLVPPQLGNAAEGNTWAVEPASGDQEEYLEMISAAEYQDRKPAVSGPYKEVPWTLNEKFQTALEANPVNVLKAAYRTVLHDPLPGEEYNVHLAAEMLCGILIEPGAVFSQNQSIGPYTAERGFRWGPTYANGELIKTIGGGVCKIASTLYNTAVLSNLEIVERYNHTMPVPYVPYGQDATVSYGIKDMKFRNDSGEPLMIWAQGIDNVLYIAIYGRTNAPLVEWRHQVIGTTKASKTYKYNNGLATGIERVLLEGMDGMKVKSWVTITDGGQVTEKFMGVSTYKPMPWLIERGGG